MLGVTTVGEPFRRLPIGTFFRTNTNGGCVYQKVYDNRYILVHHRTGESTGMCYLAMNPDMTVTKVDIRQESKA